MWALRVKGVRLPRAQYRDTWILEILKKVGNFCFSFVLKKVNVSCVTRGSVTFDCMIHIT